MRTIFLSVQEQPFPFFGRKIFVSVFIQADKSAFQRAGKDMITGGQKRHTLQICACKDR